MKRGLTLSQFFGVLAFFAAVAVFFASQAAAQTPTITRVEEDWELIVANPSPTSGAPQVICVIAPVGDTSSLYSAFLLNQRGSPESIPGGLQLQAWNADTLLASKQHSNEALLATTGETIRWTQVMRLSENNLVFEVVNGVSTTWGNFGADQSLQLAVGTTLSSLNAYSPDLSVKQSAVTYGDNRVRSLALKHVRLYSGAQLVAEDNTSRSVHSLGE